MTTDNTKAVTPGQNGQPLDQSEEDELAKAEVEANEKASQAEGDETSSTESAPANQTTSEEGESDSEESKSVDGSKTPDSDSGTSDEDKTSDEEFVKNLSPKAQKRFEKLSRKAKDADILRVENERLKARGDTPKVPELTLSKPRSGQSGDLPWETKNDEAGGEQFLTENELNQRVAKTVTETIEVRETANQFFSDVKTVEKEYPVLNADHDEYDEDLANKVSSWYESIALQRTEAGGLVFKPNAPTFRAFVDQVMSIRAKAGEQGKRSVTTSVLKQAAKQAVSSPGTSSAGSGNEIEETIRDPKTSLEDAEALANKGAKG